ncbi:MAG: phasin family protein [Hydrogenophaga sp.]|nr:phasin family protein [Hydrogenophaga sp.]
MVTKTHKSGAAKAKTATTATFGSPLSGAIKDSAQQIWLAGLGAFSKAQAEGGKAFDTLVKEGLSIQRKTQAVAEERLTEATQRMSSMANEIGSKAAGQWDKLENIFEDRVAKALNKLGVPSARDIEALIERIDALSAAVERQGGKVAAPRKVAAAKKPAAKTAARKTPARKKAA